MGSEANFDSKKMKVECGKLLRISNLGEKTLMGYIQNLGQNLSNDFTELEWKFLRETTKMLIPSSVYVCAEYEDKEAIVEWNKALIKATLNETALPYVMTHTEEIHCRTKEEILTLYRKRYFFQNLFLFLAKDLVRFYLYAKTFPTLMPFPAKIGDKIFDNFYEYLSSLTQSNRTIDGGADDCIIAWLNAFIPLPNYINDIYWWYLVEDEGFPYYKDLMEWYLKSTSVLNSIKDDICDYTRVLLTGGC